MQQQTDSIVSGTSAPATVRGRCLDCPGSCPPRGHSGTQADCPGCVSIPASPGGARRPACGGSRGPSQGWCSHCHTVSDGEGYSRQRSRHPRWFISEVGGHAPCHADSRGLSGVRSPELKGARWTKGALPWLTVPLACRRARWEFSWHLNTNPALSPYQRSSTKLHRGLCAWPCPGCWGHSGRMTSLVPALREEQI